MHGLLDVKFDREGKKTILREVRQRSPLKVLRALYPEGDAPAHLYILYAAGGILEGDRIEVDLHLKPYTEVLVTTPAATKVHPMRSGEGRQAIRLTLGRGSVLEYLQEPVLPFSGAAFLQDVDIFLEEGASLFWTDIVGPGRYANGESFSYRRYENRMRIRDAEGIISQESFCLIPEEEPIDVLGVMEDYTHYGSLYLFCEDPIREELLRLIQSIEAVGLLWGATLLSRRGIVVRSLAHETPVLKDFFKYVWSLFRLEVMGRLLPPLRRY